jgi:hypothetical protein
LARLDGLLAVEGTGDGRPRGTDGLADGRGGLQFAVEHDGELTDGTAVAFGDLGGEVAELLGTLRR